MDKQMVGRRLRSWMVDADTTPGVLASAIGVKPTTVKAWMYGVNGLSFEAALALADYFGKSLDELACRERVGDYAAKVS